MSLNLFCRALYILVTTQGINVIEIGLSGSLELCILTWYRHIIFGSMVLLHNGIPNGELISTTVTESFDILLTDWVGGRKKKICRTFVTYLAAMSEQHASSCFKIGCLSNVGEGDGKGERCSQFNSAISISRKMPLGAPRLKQLHPSKFKMLDLTQRAKCKVSIFVFKNVLS